MAIKTTNGFFNWLKSKFYLKTEIDSKLADKASTDVASTSANGLMSSTDKIKLDGIASGANKTVVDSAMSSSSVNPVQNKIIHQELENKSDITHNHDDRYYTESEMNTKLNAKANTTVATTSANGLMSSTDKVKLNGIATGANKTTVDSALSSTSTNPVQNKVVKSQVDSLNSAKANKDHTHNDNSGLIQLDCSYGNVWKFKKNGWVTVIWGNLNATSMATGSWVTLASTGWSNQAPAHNYYGNFVQADSDTCRVTVNPEGVLRCFKPSSSAKEITYGYIIYPTAD